MKRIKKKIKIKIELNETSYRILKDYLKDYVSCLSNFDDINKMCGNINNINNLYDNALKESKIKEEQEYVDDISEQVKKNGYK